MQRSSRQSRRSPRPRRHLTAGRATEIRRRGTLHTAAVHRATRASAWRSAEHAAWSAKDPAEPASNPSPAQSGTLQLRASSPNDGFAAGAPNCHKPVPGAASEPLRTSARVPGRCRPHAQATPRCGRPVNPRLEKLIGTGHTSWALWAQQHGVCRACSPLRPPAPHRITDPPRCALSKFGFARNKNCF
jgi:hypothetical protein